MKSALEIFLEIILAIFGAVFFGSLAIGLVAFGVGCALFGTCWGFMGWRKRRAGKGKRPD